MITIGCLAAVILFAVIWPGTPAGAQSGSFFNQRDDTYRLLGLKRAKEVYEVARNEYERQKTLFERQLITQAEIDRARSAFSDAEVNFQQSLLAVLFEQQFISVASAVKYHAPDGGRHVRLTLANTSGGSAEFQKLLNLDDKLFRTLQPDVVTNVYVSLFNDQNAIISQPYEAKINELRYGDPRTVDFALLQDLDAVTVAIIYGNGSQRSMKIFLQKDVSVNKVAIQSEQFSQEVELGKKATFDLTLELFSGGGNTFGLEVINLPPEISRFFKDPSNQARLSQVRFTESTRSKKAALEIALPDRPTGPVIIDQPIAFYVLAVPADKGPKSAELAGKTWTEVELDQLGVGYAKLELLPRGQGKLLVQSQQLYHAITKGDSVTLAMDLINEGSRRLDNVELRVDLPLNWTKRIEPTTVPALEIGAETQVRLTFLPPVDVAVGKYDIRVRSTATSGGQPVTGEDKTVTVEIKAGANVLGTTVLVLLIVGLVGAVVALGIKLTRR
ncbi:MAG: NEW3 domain-containing protein [candidate division Zixibacteria bacterium]|nr:NEW3 domain-containing protein [candidate division Zixibacteria bacterium]